MAISLPAITGAQRPLHRPSLRSLPPHPRFARGAAGLSPRLKARSLLDPEDRENADDHEPGPGYGPRSDRFCNYWGSAPPPAAKLPEPPPSPRFARFASASSLFP